MLIVVADVETGDIAGQIVIALLETGDSAGQMTSLFVMEIH